MLKYNKKDNVLVIKKMEDLDINFNLLDNQKKSYAKYLNETIHEDAKYLEKIIKAISDKFETYNFKCSIRVESKRPVSNIYGSKTQVPDMYYQTYLDVEYAGCNHTYEFLRIPYMDDYAVLNVNGRRNVLLNELLNMEGLSWDKKDNTLTLTTVNRAHRFTYKITNTCEDIVLEYNSKRGSSVKISYLELLDTMLKSESENVDDCLNLFSNPLVSYGKELSKTIIPDYKNTKLNNTNILTLLSEDYFPLGKLRADLNSKLSINACLGQTLSRDIVLRNGDILEEGRVITPAILINMKKNLLNEVHIRKIPSISGQSLCKEIVIKTIPAGVLLSSSLSKILPSDAKLGEYTTEVIKDANIVVAASTLLTEDLLNFLSMCGVKKVSCVRGQYFVDYTFEQEVIGNKTARVIDFWDKELPKGYTADSYIYLNKISNPYNPAEWVKCPNYLTCWDLMGLVSYIARIVYMPELRESCNRDTDFLKRIGGCNETFSYAFKVAIKKHLATYSNKARESFLSKQDPCLFYAFTQEWLKVMRETKKLLAQADDINPVSLLKQVNTVSTWVKDSKSVKEELRTIAIGSYGRFCPYSFPAGRKMGLVNTLAIGCKINDEGVMLAPYRKIISVNNNGSHKTLSKNIVWLSVLEEQEKKIGDALSLKFDDNGYIIPTNVMAKIPVKTSSDEKVEVATVKSTDLDYVNAFAEQFLSPTAALIPFAAGNDAARITFGINLMTQAIYLQNGEIPLVRTKMYKDIYTYSNDFVIRAKEDGYVDSIDKNQLAVRYDNQRSMYDDDLDLIEFEETKFYNLSTIAMRYRVRPGDRFKKGDILVDSPVSRDGIFSPGANMLTVYMPWHGYNYEDAIVLSDAATDRLVSIHPNECVYTADSTKYNVHINSVNTGDYITKGQSIGTITKTRINDAKSVLNEDWYASENGWLYDATQHSIEDETVITARLLSFDRVQVGDKLSGRHGNKGCSALIEETKNMPVFNNGQLAEVILNPTGVPSRMNIGQLLDATAGFIAYILGTSIESEAFNGASMEDLQLLMQYIWDLANLKSTTGLKAKYPNIPTDLHEHAFERIEEIRKWENCFNPDCTARLYNPTTGKYFNGTVAFGMPYILKIKQEVDHKMHARGGMFEEPYSLIDDQPPKGSSNCGGQRTGEMEANALLAHGAADFAREMFNSRSDNVEQRVKAYLESLNIDPSNIITDAENAAPRSMYILRYLLEVLGVSLDIDNYPGISKEDVKQLKSYSGDAIYKYTVSGNKKIKNEDEAMTDEEVEACLQNLSVPASASATDTSDLPF